MKSDRNVILEGMRPHQLQIGGVYTSKVPTVIRTVLGSCVAVCLYDLTNGVGGMNHFMLPVAAPNTVAGGRYGSDAMDMLLTECLKAGADRRFLQAKVFGGGYVLRVRSSDGDVPQSNIKYALTYLERVQIPIASKDVGGNNAREVFFFTETGKVLLKRLFPAAPSDKAEWNEVERAERTQLGRLNVTRDVARDAQGQGV